MTKRDRGLTCNWVQKLMGGAVCLLASGGWHGGDLAVVLLLPAAVVKFHGMICVDYNSF